jgi:hypothetical protein
LLILIIYNFSFHILKQRQKKRPFGKEEPSVLKWIPGGVYPARSRRDTGMTALESGILTAFGVIPYWDDSTGGGILTTFGASIIGVI